MTSASRQDRTPNHSGAISCGSLLLLLALLILAGTAAGITAVGASGTIRTTPDLEVWNTQSSGTTAVLNDVWGDGEQYIAVGASNTVRSSYDGSAWQIRSTSALASTIWNSVMTGENGSSGPLWVIVGNGGNIHTSPDGVTWSSTNSQSLATANIHDVAFGRDLEGNPIWIGVGAGGNFRYWNAAGTGGPWASWMQGPQNLNAVTYGDGRFVAVGAGGTILTSQTGQVNWGHAMGSLTPPTELRAITRGAGADGDPLWITVGASGTIRSSPDGWTWGPPVQPAPTNQALNAVTYDGSQFIAVGQQGVVVVSPDGVTWTTRTSGTSNALNGVSPLATDWANNPSAARSTITTDPSGIAADGDTHALVTVQLRYPNGTDYPFGGHPVCIRTTAGTVSGAGKGPCIGAAVLANDHGDGTYSAMLTSTATPGQATVTATLGGMPLYARATVDFLAAAIGPLAATPVATDMIELIWKVHPDESGFNEIEVHRGGPGFTIGPTTKRITLSADATSHSDTGLAADWQYCYIVRAIGEEVERQSNRGCTKTHALPPPPAQFGQLRDFSVAVGTTIDLKVRATHPDGLQITLEAPSLPGSAMFVDHGDGTGDFTWATQPGEEGVYTDVVFHAFLTEHEGLDPASATIQITVKARAFVPGGTGDGGGGSSGGTSYSCPDCQDPSDPTPSPEPDSNGDGCEMGVPDDEVPEQCAQKETPGIGSETPPTGSASQQNHSAETPLDVEPEPLRVDATRAPFADRKSTSGGAAWAFVAVLATIAALVGLAVVVNNARRP